MSVLDGASRCCLLHEGGEARIYKVWVGGKVYSLKWYGEGTRFHEKTLESLQLDRSGGVYRILETGLKEGRSYIVYEFIEGAVSNKIAPLPVAVALNALRKVVSALKILSEKGIHHGDLNPANVIFDLEGAPVLIDCGIVGPGALAYAAPERFRGKEPSEKSDLFSLALLLYFWISGEDLVQAKDFEGFATAMAQADSLDPTGRLFEKLGSDEFSKGNFSLLEPIWKGLLQIREDDRVEDFEELDELLEIAFDRICGGEVVWVKTEEAFLRKMIEKNGTECAKDENSCELPRAFAVTQPTGVRYGRICVIVSVIILLLVALAFLLKPVESEIDEMGALMLKNSRSLDLPNASGNAGADSPAVDMDSVSGTVLEALPLPHRSDSVK